MPIFRGDGGSGDSNTDATGKICEANHGTSGKELVSGSLSLVEVFYVEGLVVGPGSWLGREENSDDNTVDSNGLTEDDGDQVLGGDSWGLDRGSDDARARDEDTTI